MPPLTAAHPLTPTTTTPRQERIVTIGFGTREEVFQHSIFLVLCNRLLTCALAATYMLASSLPRRGPAGATSSAAGGAGGGAGAPSWGPAAPLHSYVAVSLTNVIATSCQYEALKHVSFAVQTLAKSAKALPVMLWGTVFLQKRYRSVGGPGAPPRHAPPRPSPPSRPIVVASCRIMPALPCLGGMGTHVTAC